MKKLLITTFVAVFMAALIMPVFAQTGKPPIKAGAVIQEILGTVVTIDAAKKEIMVKNRTSGQEETYVVDAKALSLLKEGDHVSITTKCPINQIMRL